MRLSSLGIGAVLAASLVACATHGTKRTAVARPPAPLPPAAVRSGDCSAKNDGSRLRPLGTTETSSAVALADHDGRPIALVADEDEKALHLVDVGARNELSTIPLMGTPSHVLVALDGRVLVTLRDEAKVQVLNVPDEAEKRFGALVTRCIVPTAAEPIAIAETIDATTFVVTSGWGHALEILAAKDLSSRGRVDLPREPRGVHIGPNGRTAVVAHLIGSNVSVVDLDTQDVRTIDAHGVAETREIRVKIPEEERPKPPRRAYTMKPSPVIDTKIRKQTIRRHAINGVAFALIDKKMIGPRVLVDPGEVDEAALYYGNGDRKSEISDVLILDSELRPVREPPKKQPVLVRGARGFEKEIASDDPVPLPSSGCQLPRSIAHNTDDDTALVACLGSNMLLEYAVKPTAAFIRREWPVASGPIAVAYDASAKQAIVWSQFEHAVSFVALKDTPKEKAVARLKLARREGVVTDAALDVALGRRLYHTTGDPRISREGLACASCHPDGRDDALTWATQEGPRNAPMLAGRLQGTAPYAWIGSGAKLTDHLVHTISRLGGSGITPPEMEALAAYCMSMKTYGPPVPATQADAAKVARGKEVFGSSETKCASCHAPGSDNAFTDKDKHDVGTRTVADATTHFDTPSLRFVGSTAPYFHDGRYTNLRDLLVKSSGKMGQTSHLSASDLDALEAYLKTL